MPQKTVDQLKAKTARLKKKIVEKGATMEAAALRKTKKQIRRAQRSRRTKEARAKQLAGKTEAPAA
jgi:hypothetical protein